MQLLSRIPGVRTVESLRAKKQSGSTHRGLQVVTGPDPDTLPGYPGWSLLVEFHYTIPRECTKGPHLKEK